MQAQDRAHISPAITPSSRAIGKAQFGSIIENSYSCISWVLIKLTALLEVFHLPGEGSALSSRKEQMQNCSSMIGSSPRENRAWMFIIECSLLGVHFWVFISGCSFLDVYFWVFIIRCSFLGVHYWMFIFGCSLLGVHFWMFIIGCSLLDVIIGCSLLGVHYWVLITGC